VVGLGLVLAISLAVIMPRPGQAFTLIEAPAWVFGPSVVARGQNAVLGVVNWGDNVAQVELTIVDAASTKTILAQKQFTLLPGNSDAITFSLSSGGDRPLEISAIVTVRFGSNRREVLANLASSLEIMDPAGSNRVHIAPTLLPAVQLPAVQ